MRDRTARKREEEALERAERVKSLGLLAGGIAHDFNNILGGILGNLSLASNAESLSEAKELMAAAEKAAERAKSLTARLLELSKASHPLRRDTDLQGLTKEVLSFCTTGTAIETSFDAEEGLPTVAFDRSQLGNALENLMLNAVQALGGRGRIDVSIRHGEIGPHGDRTDGGGVEVVIQDDGPGIPPDKRAKVFEPYFTTKEGGSGLGLALALSIARKHGGDLVLESPAAGGCRFVLRLPASKMQDDPKTRGDEPKGGQGQEARARTKGRPMTIVLMDDDELVREPLGRLLSRRGHRVYLASSGEELMAMLERGEPEASAVDAAVLDLTVRGGMGGAETLRNLRARGYSFPCIACSGYASAKDAGSAGRQGFAAFVPKPAKAEDIEEAAYKVMG
jgi:CheY-like chemotaxis protein/two-component sensor histidine kinase